MSTLETLEILSRDAQYDLACACGTKKGDDHRKRGTDGGWLYPVTVPGGGSGIMLKTLMTNSCSSDCRYCPLRKDQDTRRVALQPEKLARFFMDIQSRRKLIGLFLSSGILDTPDRTMQMLIDTARILRRHYSYRGYIHIKIIPGASREAIREAVSLSHAVSLNIETPGEKHFSLLSRTKSYMEDIINPLKYLSQITGPEGPYRRVSKTTQFIVGASHESDRDILRYMWRLYKNLGLNRIYFSAYQQGLGDSSIPGEQRDISSTDQVFMREHRLYQADFLVRSYGFSFDDFIFDQGHLSLEEDPKLVWARSHPEYFPLNVQQAGKAELLRVPGLGPAMVKRIMAARKVQTLKDLSDAEIPAHLARKALGYVRFT